MILSTNQLTYTLPSLTSGMPLATLPHRVMIDALEEIQLPKIYVDIIKDVYCDSELQVICGKDLTRPIPLEVGIKTGCLSLQ